MSDNTEPLEELMGRFSMGSKPRVEVVESKQGGFDVVVNFDGSYATRELAEDAAEYARQEFDAVLERAK